MVKIRRNSIIMAVSFGFWVLAGLLFLVFPLACEGQYHYNPNSKNKTAQSGIRKAEHSGVRQQPEPQHPYVPQQVLVKFNPDADPETIARIQAELKLEKISEFRSDKLFLMKIVDGTSVEAIIAKLKTYPAVNYAEPNYVVKANP